MYTEVHTRTCPYDQSKHTRRVRSISTQFHFSNFHFFSHPLDQILDKKELKQGMGYSGSWLEGTAHHGQEGMGAETAHSCGSRNMNVTFEASGNPEGQGARPGYKPQGGWVSQQPTSSR